MTPATAASYVPSTIISSTEAHSSDQTPFGTSSSTLRRKPTNIGSGWDANIPSSVSTQSVFSPFANEMATFAVPRGASSVPLFTDTPGSVTQGSVDSLPAEMHSVLPSNGNTVFSQVHVLWQQAGHFGGTMDHFVRHLSQLCDAKKEGTGPEKNLYHVCPAGSPAGIAVMQRTDEYGVKRLKLCQPGMESDWKTVVPAMVSANEQAFRQAHANWQAAGHAGASCAQFMWDIWSCCDQQVHPGEPEKDSYFVILPGNPFGMTVHRRLNDQGVEELRINGPGFQSAWIPKPSLPAVIHANWLRAGNEQGTTQDFQQVILQHCQDPETQKVHLDDTHRITAFSFKPAWQQESVMVWQAKDYDDTLANLVFVLPSMPSQEREELLNQMRDFVVQRNPLISAHVKWQQAGHDKKPIEDFLAHVSHCLLQPLKVRVRDGEGNVLAMRILLDGHDQPLEIWRRIGAGGCDELYIPPGEGQTSNWIKVNPLAMGVAYAKWQQAGHTGLSLQYFLRDMNQHVDQSPAQRWVDGTHTQIAVHIQPDGHMQPFEVLRRVDMDGCAVLYIPSAEGQASSEWIKVLPEGIHRAHVIWQQGGHAGKNIQDFLRDMNQQVMQSPNSSWMNNAQTCMRAAIQPDGHVQPLDVWQYRDTDGGYFLCIPVLGEPLERGWMKVL